MTGHKSSSVDVAPIMIGGVPLHERLASAAPELVTVVLDRLVEQLPAYAHLPREQLRGDITRIIERGIRSFAEIVRTGEPAPPEVLTTLREAIEQRAEEGVPIDAVLSAHHLGVQASWEYLGETAEPDDLDGALRLGRLQLRYLQDVTAAVSAGYFQERQALFSEEQDARQGLLSALLEGGASGDAAARAGIRLPPSYFVLGVMIGAHPDERRSDVDASVAARRKLRRLRTELERSVREPVLSTLTPDGGVALIPSTATESNLSAAERNWVSGLVSSAGRAAGADTTASVVVAKPTAVGDAAVMARDILDVALASGRPQGIYELTDVALEFQLSQPGPAREILAALLDPLADKPDLLRTLRTYFHCGLNRRHAAKQLHVHPNTVDYRLRKIAALTGLDPMAAAELPRIHAALTAQQALDARALRNE